MQLLHFVKGLHPKHIRPMSLSQTNGDIIFIAVWTIETAVPTRVGSTSRATLCASLVYAINPTSLASIFVTHVTHDIFLQLWIRGAIHAFGTHTLNARGDVARNVSKTHFIIAKVITTIHYITIVAPIPTLILIDQ
jgi:hypothetical protein